MTKKTGVAVLGALDCNTQHEDESCFNHERLKSLCFRGLDYEQIMTESPILRSVPVSFRHRQRPKRAYRNGLWVLWRREVLVPVSQHPACPRIIFIIPPALFEALGVDKLLLQSLPCT